jgi:hypothetical protein
MQLTGVGLTAIGFTTISLADRWRAGADENELAETAIGSPVTLAGIPAS